MLSHEHTAAEGQAVWWALFAVGSASVAGYAWLVFGLETGNSWPLLHGFVALIAVLTVLQLAAWRCALRCGSSRALVRLLLIFALAFRCLLLFAGLDPPRASALANDVAGREGGYEKFLLYDNDVWRFLWDGHLITHGLSPYRYAPVEVADDEALEALLLDDERWWGVHDNVSFERLVTVYPPVAQLFFASATLLAPGSVFVFKLLLVGLDLGLCWLLVTMIRAGGGAVGHLVLYAWSPLVVKEVAGSGHLESLTALLLLAGVFCAALQAPRRAVLAVTAAMLTKLAPIVALPLIVKRAGFRYALPAVALTVVLCLPVATTLPRWWATVRIFAERWQFNAGPWALLRAGAGSLWPSAATALASGLCAVLILVIVVVTYRRLAASGHAVDLYAAVFVVLAAVVLLSPSVMPWYLIWALPFAVLLSALARRRLVRRLAPLWAVLCCLSMLSYYFYAEQVEYAWWRWLEYGGVAVLAAVAVARPLELKPPPELPAQQG